MNGIPLFAAGMFTLIGCMVMLSRRPDPKFALYCLGVAMGELLVAGGS